MAVLVAIGTLGAQFIWFPAGIAKAFRVQYAVNVLAGIILGPGPAVVIAFFIAVLRNLLGLGSLLAFPGGMVGAFFAGYMYKFFKRNYAAAIGEVIGSVIIGALFSVLFANIYIGISAGAIMFFTHCIVSSIYSAQIPICLS